MFGRPELIIESLLDDLQRESPPKENDLNALIKFSLKVRNLVATIRSFGPMDHLTNPLLMKTLVDQLPTQIRINWAYYKSSQLETNLTSFGDWLYNLAQVTSQVVGKSKADSTKKVRKDNPNQQRNSRTNHHCSSTKNQNSGHIRNVQSSQGSRQCPVCALGSCKRIQECSKFLSMTAVDRWNEVKNKRLCFSCLGDHRQFRCRSRKRCPENGCQMSHNVLLHDGERQANQQSSSSSSAAKAKISTSDNIC